MSRARWIGAGVGALALATVVAVGCVAAPDNREAKQGPPEDGSADRKDAVGTAEPAAGVEELDELEAEEAEPTLDDYERQLANVEDRLRGLGVAVDGDAIVEEEPADVTTEDGEKSKEETRGTGKNKGGGKKSTSKPKPNKPKKPSLPSSEPTAPGGIGGGGSNSGSSDLSEKDVDGTGKLDDFDHGRDKGVGEGDRVESKAAQGPPAETETRERAAARCESICELGVVTCELSNSICELAERHPDEDDYEAACERAQSDCTVAKDACDGCDD